MKLKALPRLFGPLGALLGKRYESAGAGAERRAPLPKRALKRYGRPKTIVTDQLRFHRAATGSVELADRQQSGRWLNNKAEKLKSAIPTTRGAMARFRSIKTLQKLNAVHASIPNHFHQDRHFTPGRTLDTWVGVHRL